MTDVAYIKQLDGDDFHELPFFGSEFTGADFNPAGEPIEAEPVSITLSGERVAEPSFFSEFRREAQRREQQYRMILWHLHHRANRG